MMNERSSTVYPRPTVSQVVFQIRYPNLFMIEDRIGEFQSLIIDRFPESSLIVRKQLLFADYVDKIDIETIPTDKQFARKIWNFKSEDNYLKTEGYYNWGSSIINGDDGQYHLFYSRWKKG